MKRLIASLAAAALFLPAARTRAADTVPSQALPVATGNLTLGSGPPFQWQYHFDHNALDLAPPYSRHPSEPQMIPPSTAWSDTRVLVDPAGTIYTVSSGDISPGTRATGTWRGGKPVTLRVEHSDLATHAALVTPDGQLWTICCGKIHRFASGKWVLAGTTMTRHRAWT